MSLIEPDELKEKKMIFITDNINELMIQDRRYILQIIYNSSMRSNIKENGSGTQIKMEELTNDMITQIHDIINVKLQENNLQLKLE